MSGEPHKPRQRDKVWYAAGLRFSCVRCRQCCTGPPGYVWVAEDEMAAIAGFLGVSVQELAKGHCRRVWLRVSLKEHSNGDCVFLTDEGCRVYPVRPSQCRTFPFWKANLRSERAWDAAKGRCPGMGCGRLYSREEIEQIMAGNQPT